MHRGAIVGLALLVSVAALPQDANARSRQLPGLLGVITAPIGAILGAGRRAGRAHRLAHHTPHQPRSTASGSISPAASAAAASVSAAGVAAAAAASSEPPAHETETPQSAIKADANAGQTAKPLAAASAEPGTSQAAAARAEAPPTTASIPAASASSSGAPAQRNAALSLPNIDLRPSIKEPPRGGAPQPSSHLGLVGPLTWSSAFEDIIGTALWPDQYGERLRTHGIADVLGAAFIAPATLTAKARADAGGTAIAAGTCSKAATASPDWPAAEIERATRFSADQRAALDQFKAAIGNAVTSIAATCRDTAALSPVERLQAMQATLWAVHDAAQLVRAPLAAFYDSLSDEQKKQFAAHLAKDADAGASSRGEMARMCGMPVSLESTMHQIDRSLQVTKVQRTSLDALNKKSFEMAQFLMASCLKPVPATPVERLANAADRLTAVLFAASTLGPAVNDFYAALNDEQKTKLKALH